MGGLEIELPSTRKIALVRAAVDHIQDGIGADIDKGIRETIVLLQSLDMPTAMSCEGRHPGHDEDFDGRFTAPYIDIAFEFSLERLKPETRIKLINYLQTAWQNMTELLAEFYGERNIEQQYKLQIDPPHDTSGSFRLSNTIAFEHRHDVDLKEQNVYDKCRKEIDDFTAFLRERFFINDDGGKFDLEQVPSDQLPQLLEDLDDELRATESYTLKSAIDRLQEVIRTKLQSSVK